MIVIQTRDDGTPREVELTTLEADADALFNNLLSEGLEIAPAATLVEMSHPGLDPAFYDFLRR